MSSGDELLNHLFTSGPKQQLEPLTAQQEVQLVSDNESDKVEENESDTGIHEDLSSPSEFNGTSNDNKLDNGSGTYIVDSYTSNDNSATKTVPIQEDLQNISALDETSVGPDTTPIPPKLPESEVVGGSFVASSLRESDSNLDIDLPEATSEVEDKLINVREIIDTDLSEPLNLDNHLDEGKLGSEGKENSNIAEDSSFSSSSTNVNVSFSVSSEVEPILEPQSVPKDNLETIESSPTKDNLKGSETMQFSVQVKNSFPEVNNLNENESSETTFVSAQAHPLTNEQQKIDYKDINDSKPIFESPIPRSSFSPAGIPAPSLVSAAPQVHPGKILVPAVVDQVQGQAIAALQVLKVYISQ